MAVCDGVDFVCNDGYFRSGSSCQTCPAQCICVGQTVVQCGEGQKPDPARTVCVVDEPEDFKLSKSQIAIVVSVVTVMFLCSVGFGTFGCVMCYKHHAPARHLANLLRSMPRSRVDEAKIISLSKLRDEVVFNNLNNNELYI